MAETKGAEERNFLIFVHKYYQGHYEKLVGVRNPRELSIFEVPDAFLSLSNDPELQSLYQKMHHGQGLEEKEKETIIIPDNKADLLERLHVLFAAKDAGHNNVEDEKKAILERLLDKKHITPEDYKKLNKVKTAHKKL